MSRIVDVSNWDSEQMPVGVVLPFQNVQEGLLSSFSGSPNLIAGFRNCNDQLCNEDHISGRGEAVISPHLKVFFSQAGDNKGGVVAIRHCEGEAPNLEACSQPAVVAGDSLLQLLLADIGIRSEIYISTITPTGGRGTAAESGALIEFYPILVVDSAFQQPHLFPGSETVVIPAGVGKQRIVPITRASLDLPREVQGNTKIPVSISYSIAPYLTGDSSDADCTKRVGIDPLLDAITVSIGGPMKPYECLWRLTAIDATTLEELHVVNLTINTTDCFERCGENGRCREIGTPYDGAANCVCDQGFGGAFCEAVQLPGNQSAATQQVESTRTAQIVGGIAGGLAALMLLAMIIWRLRLWREKNRPLCFDESLERMKRRGLVSRDDAPPHGGGPREIKRSRLKLLGSLGEGAFGVVVKAFLDEEVERGVPGFTVAAKMMKDESPEAIMDFQDEAALMAHLQHHNVLPLIGVCTKGPSKLIITAYCGYGDLKTYLQKNGQVRESPESPVVSIVRSCEMLLLRPVLAPAKHD